MTVDDLVPLFSGTPEANLALARLLDEAEIHCLLREAPGSRGQKSVVLVPATELEEARVVLRGWLAASTQRADSLSRRLARIIPLGLMPAAVWLIAWLAIPAELPGPLPVWLVGLAVVGLAVVARVENRRHHDERIRFPD
jgi:hypothetical protein